MKTYIGIPLKIIKSGSLFLLLIITFSCSHVQLEYRNELEFPDKKTGQFVYKKSYEVGSIKTWCAITGILYGGACWGYLGLPFKDLQDRLKREAENKLKTMADRDDFNIKKYEIVRLGWEDFKEEQSLDYDFVSTKTQVHPQIQLQPQHQAQPVKTNPEQNDDEIKGFIR